ncbi:FAD-dependent oxidoreductase [Ectothiorhodospiraceae bacterium WFHF3C12]|nr:FAD-dependent oxidoreductase [Ectothiorhodospiraceae bacterium WFHF3C12]
MVQARENPVYPYRRSPDQDGEQPAHHPVIVVGAGPIGLSAAIDLALHDVDNVLLDEDDTVSIGSRAICFAKRTLEIFDRLGCGQRMVDKGVTWNLGRVFFRENEVYRFDLLPEAGHQRPAFINLQQYFVEEYLVDRARALEGTEVRWKNRVTAVEPGESAVHLTVETPDGPYAMTCDYLIVADGARSPVRHMLGFKSEGQVFQDRFLIADVVMKADFPPERWFWFDPPFHEGQSTLLHRQSENVWRIDFQLGWDADPEEEKRPERVIPRIRAMLGEDAEFELEWVSVYTFQCRRMESFRPLPRVFFAGDAAHQVSPFGARGANSGIQDTDNLVWKLAAVLGGRAPESLLASYDAERIPAADENILNSTRSTDFISPKGEVSRSFRDATLMLAERYPFARRLVNSGRLSVPSVLSGSPLNTPDRDPFGGRMVPGAPCADAPVRLAGGPDWLLNHLGGEFTGVYFLGAEPGMPKADGEALDALERGGIPIRWVFVGQGGDEGGQVLVDAEGLAHERYDARAGTFYLIRPDQHVAARWRGVERDAVVEALTRATGGVAVASTPRRAGDGNATSRHRAASRPAG